MKSLVLEPPITRVVCLGAHPDDIEIGAWGLIGHIASRNEDAFFDFVVLTGDSRRRTEGENSMRSLLGERAALHAADFRDGHLPYDDPSGVKQFVRESVVADPQLVIAPHVEDRHQDHSFVSLLASQVFRDHLTFGYEILKYDGDLGRPQAFVALSEEQVSAKVAHIHDHFSSQRAKDWFDDSSFRALMRLRGIECKSPGGYAEAFYVSKLLIA